MTGPLVVLAKSTFVQILNNGSHWVCINTISTTLNSETVNVFDSMFHKPSSHTIRRHDVIYPGSTVTLPNEKVQKQVGCSDCGLSSLAYAIDLCHGLDPANQRYDQSAMHQHYVSCLESGAMVPFPKTSRSAIPHVPHKTIC